ncbi:scoloptoxin SSD43-like [Scaptodrosophila lebanonensis]|uniref:Scoloptoxin SSD43-like n=1 Tax=Drosophila lebanonensis TaxID=7225 RepID=A0A6J2TA32_DROLE|nr:scoloptoxin SSD43-like [Scaptodrosophila lebanonensis]
MERLFTFLVLVLAQGEPEEIDFCHKKLCEDALKHLACGNVDWNWDDCGSDEYLVTISSSSQDLILREHNAYRNLVASGKLHGLPPAGFMLALKWNSELAFVAEVLVKRCGIQDVKQCLATNEYSDPGYNSAYNVFTGEQDEVKIIRAQIKAWYYQYRYTTISSLDTGIGQEGKEIGHFLQLIFGFNDAVGCAISRYFHEGTTVQLMYCVYGCSRDRCQLTYEVAKHAGMKCLWGVHKDYNYLCSSKEDIEGCGYKTRCVSGESSDEFDVEIWGIGV